MLRAAILILLLTACAPTREGSYAAHGADLATTGVGLAMGAAEANPLGIVALPIKIATTEYIDSLPKDAQPQAHNILQSVTLGAVGNNVCVIASIATAGAFSPVCPVIGLVSGFAYWDAAEKKRNRQWLLDWCAEWVKQGPEYTCDMGDS